MLYDPKWEVETRADPFKLKTLIAWLERKDPDEGYVYDCGGQCLLAQYFAAKGYQNVRMFTDCFYHGDKPIPGHVGRDAARKRRDTTNIPTRFNEIASRGRKTFGAALFRAETGQDDILR